MHFSFGCIYIFTLRTFRLYYHHILFSVMLFWSFWVNWWYDYVWILSSNLERWLFMLFLCSRILNLSINLNQCIADLNEQSHAFGTVMTMEFSFFCTYQVFTFWEFWLSRSCPQADPEHPYHMQSIEMSDPLNTLVMQSIQMSNLIFNIGRKWFCIQFLETL